MTKKLYVGVNEKARKVKNIYIGVNNKARSVSHAYVGINGIARLFYLKEFFLVKDIVSANVIAAYQFRHAKSKEDSRTDLTGNGYTLEYKFVKWKVNDGISWNPLKEQITVNPQVRQADLSYGKAGIKMVVIYYKDYKLISDPPWFGVEAGNSGFFTHMDKNFLMYSQSYSVREHGPEGVWLGPWGNKSIGIFQNYSEWSEYYGDSGTFTTRVSKQKAPASAVIAASASNIYINSKQISMKTVTKTGFGAGSQYKAACPHSTSDEPIVLGDRFHDFTAIAAAYYNKVLSPTQLDELAHNMRNL